eukprot:11698480-Alexandrium_andersonii.AAC.1
MSASLVGSEMCIRDRALRVGDDPVQHGGRALGDHALCREERPPPSLRAVSYTHLTLPTICSV